MNRPTNSQTSAPSREPIETLNDLFCFFDPGLVVVEQEGFLSLEDYFLFLSCDPCILLGPFQGLAGEFFTDRWVELNYIKLDEGHVLFII